MGLTESGQYVQDSLWFYAPNKAAPVVFATFFMTSGIMHLCQCFKYKSWRVTGLLPWSATLFIVGYILRSIGSYNYSNLPIYISSIVFLYAAPPIYELSNYFVLSRLLHFLPYYSPIHPGRILVTFIGLSTLVEVLTAQGASRAANPNSGPESVKVGKDILKATLLLQLAILALFVLIAARFHRSAARASALSTASGRKVRTVLTVLYVSSALIGIRTVYRTVEYFAVADLHVTPQTTDKDINPIIRYEWFFWVFETIPMALNSGILNAHHPGRFLPEKITTYIGRDGVEREGMGMKDNRKFYAKMFDPFDLVGLIARRDKKWWDEEQVPRGDVETVAAEKSSVTAGRKGGA